MLDWLTEEERKTKGRAKALKSLSASGYDLDDKVQRADKARMETALAFTAGELRAYRRCISRAKREAA